MDIMRASLACLFTTTRKQPLLAQARIRTPASIRASTHTAPLPNDTASENFNNRIVRGRQEQLIKFLTSTAACPKLRGFASQILETLLHVPTQVCVMGDELVIS